MDMRRASVVMPLVALAAVVMAGPALAQKGEHGSVWVELARPQGDDRGHYMPVHQPREVSLTGFVGCHARVAEVKVNEVSAVLFPASYRLLGAAGVARTGFRALVCLKPDQPLTIAVTDGNGNADTVAYRPDGDATMARLGQLRAALESDGGRCLRLANAYAWNGDYDDCWPLYHQSLQMEPGSALGAYFFGLALCDGDRWDEAIAQFRRSLELAPSFYVAHYNIGRWYERSGDHDGAVREFQTAIAARPEFVEAHLRLGEALAHAGHWNEAAAEFDTSLQHDPKLALAHVGLGAVLAHNGHHAQAAAEYQQAVALSPSSAEAHHGLGATLAHRGDLDEAAAELDVAQRLRPGDPAIAVSVAWVQRQKTGKKPGAHPTGAPPKPHPQPGTETGKPGVYMPIR